MYPLDGGLASTFKCTHWLCPWLLTWSDYEDEYKDEEEEFVDDFKKLGRLQVSSLLGSQGMTWVPRIC